MLKIQNITIKIKVFILFSFLFSTHVFAQNEFITIWDMSIPASSNSTNTSLIFGVETEGPVSYTWESAPSGTTGSGSFNSTISCTIDNLPAGEKIKLKIEAANFKRFYNDYTFDAARLIDVKQWGTANWISMKRAFSYCSNLEISGVDIPDLSYLTDMSFMFAECEKIKDITNLNIWNTEKVTDMNNMFRNCKSYNGKISDWNMKSVTNMEQMFVSCLKFNQDINNWNVSSVTNMSAMFAGCLIFNSNLDKWNIENVTNTSGMFSGAFAFNQKLDNWNTGNVKNMSSMFSSAKNFNQNIGNWNTSSVKGFAFMFNNAKSFNQNLGNWDLRSSLGLPNFFTNSGLSCSNYSKTLLGWSKNINTPNNLMLFSNGLKYYGEVYNDREVLINKGWTIEADSKIDFNETTKNGNWNDASTWSCGEIPLIDYDTKIKLGHVISLPAGETGYSKNLILEGELKLGTGATLIVKPNN